jgi:hypothetical protein
MFHYRCFGYLGRAFAAGGWCNLLQAQADYGNCGRLFTNCCNLLQNTKTYRFGVPMGSPHCPSR